MGEIQTRSFYSEKAGGDLSYSIYLPNKEGPSKNGKIVYLLHGLFGSSANWFDLTTIFDSGNDPGVTVVMPDAGDNWYTDRPGAMFETLISEDLVGHAEGSGRQAAGRIIAGISMGGYGALKIAFLHPERFELAAAFSGAFHAASLNEHRSGDVTEIEPSIKDVFGNMSAAEIERNDLFRLVAKVDAAAARLPKIYFDCGTDDSFIGVNREFHQLLTENGIAHEFRERPGGHDWDYWDKNVGAFLRNAAAGSFDRPFRDRDQRKN